jgi:sugar lactone lactonase YvrE
MSTISCCVFGQTYTINTFAGGALPVNIPGTSAALGGPQAGAVDATGNLFFSVSGGLNVVLRLDAITNVLALVAGNGTLGYSGDGGPATSAQLAIPNGVALDAAGNLYIADAGNHCIRKVSNGVITTVAGNGTSGYSGDGGPATTAQLAIPWGVAVDAAGNLYIGDFSNYRVRKVSNGVMTTVAGNGTRGYSGDGGPATSAELTQPQGVAVDGAGNLYIADGGNQRIRKVANGVIATVAGNGTLGFSGDKGPATSAQLSTPEYVAVDSAGNLYIADLGNSRVRLVSNGVITTVVGNGTAGFGGDNGPAISAQLNGPLGMAVDSAGNLYIADYQNHRVRKVSNGLIASVAGNGTLGESGDGGPATSAQMNLPSGVAVDSAGGVYSAESNDELVRKVSNGVIATVAGNGTNGFSGDNGPATSAELWSPESAALDAAGNLYIADFANKRVREVSNGAIATVAGNGTAGFSGDNGPATSAELNGPIGVAVDSTGNLYIADRANNRIRRVSNGTIATAAGNGTAGYSGDNGPAASAELKSPDGVAVDSGGNLYIADSGNNVIRKVSSGLIATVAGNGTAGFSGDNGPATSAELNAPWGVALDSTGNLYISDSGNNRVRKVSNGVIVTVAGTGTAGFSGDNGLAASAQVSDPSGIAVDSGGNVYLADANNERIRVLTPCSAVVSPLTWSIAASGGNITINIQTAASCPWAIGSLPAWITYSGTAAGTGPASVTLSVAPNSGAAQTATLSIAGAAVTVNQGTTHPAFLAGEVTLSNGVYYLQFPDGNLFGYYSYAGNGWIYHFDMGYEYVIPAASGNGASLFDLSSGHWWYTSGSAFPYVYDFTLKAWLYYFPDTKNAGHYTTSPRYFVNLTTNQIFTM